jgi:serine/threonine protein kinase
MDHLSDNSIGRLRDLIDLPDLTGTKYRIVRPIASGGMGSVYLVEDAELRREVALKVLTTPLDIEPLYARMMREAQIVAMLEHPAIVPIHDVGKLVDGRPYYIMKHVQGVTLPLFLSTSPTLAEKLIVLQKICQAVGFAHSRGVIHRDLKPDNIMVGSFGEALVMDWGTARSLTVGSSHSANSSESKSLSGDAIEHTAQGTVVGTPSFMSPEQAGGDVAHIDERTDIFGLGAILYFLLTGCTLYKADSPEATRQAAQRGDIRPPREIDPQISKPIEAICRKALALERSDRYQNASAFERDIHAHLAGEPVLAYRENLIERSHRWLGRHQFVVIIVLVYIILRIIIFFWLGR